MTAGTRNPSACSVMHHRTLLGGQHTMLVLRLARAVRVARVSVQVLARTPAQAPVQALVQVPVQGQVD